MDENLDNSGSITLLLNEWNLGNKESFDKVIQFVYDDLHLRAAAYLKNERQEFDLNTTDLLHEAFVKLVDKQEIKWNDRNHFFAIAAKVMRRILVDFSRNRTREKRGGNNIDLPLEEARHVHFTKPRVDLAALDEALKRLAIFDPRQEKIVELKYFAGMTLDETAEVLGVSTATVKREWSIAKTWLRKELET